MELLIGGYLLLAAALVYFSAELGELVDLLDKKTTMASAFIGGVLLAAVTSLPEMFTSLTSVISIGKPGLVIGNVLGSNIFNMFVLGLVGLLWSTGLKNSNITKSHMTTTTSAIATYALLSVVMIAQNSLYFWQLSVTSLVIFGFYAWSIRSMSNDTDTADREDTSTLTLRQVVIRFVMFACLLVVASIVITYLSDLLSTQLGWGATYAGALLLGIVTSLPEMISCFVLAKRGNFNALFGNIMGSVMFNFAILLLADLAYLQGPIYIFDTQSALLVGLGTVGALATITQVSLLVRSNDAVQTRKKIALLPLSAVMVVAYLVFVVVGATL